MEGRTSLIIFCCCRSSAVMFSFAPRPPRGLKPPKLIVADYGARVEGRAIAVKQGEIVVGGGNTEEA